MQEHTIVKPRDTGVAEHLLHLLEVKLGELSVPRPLRLWHVLA